MKSQTKLAFGLLAMAVTASACGSSAAAVGKAAQPVVNISKAGPCNSAPGMLIEPKTTPATPTASSCWANGLYVGDGSLQSKQIIFASKEADLMQYEASPAMFVDATKWAAWKKDASQYMDTTVITGMAAQQARALNAHQTFAVSTGNLLASSGLAKTDPSECQSSVVLVKSEPAPQYLVTESDVVQNAVVNGKTASTHGSYTDVLAQVNGQFKMVGQNLNGEIPPCVG